MELGSTHYQSACLMLHCKFLNLVTNKEILRNSPSHVI